MQVLQSTRLSGHQFSRQAKQHDVFHSRFRKFASSSGQEKIAQTCFGALRIFREKRSDDCRESVCFAEMSRRFQDMLRYLQKLNTIGWLVA